MMTVEEKFAKRMTVTKGNHYCMFCDRDAKFVITDTTVKPQKEFSMCQKCAEHFKKLINTGLCL